MPVAWKAARAAAVVLAAALMAAGCSSTREREEESNRVGLTTQIMSDPQASATARLVAIGGSGIEGSVNFAQYGSIVVVRANVLGLPPNRQFGLHVHEGRNCTGADGSPLGGHFNPGNAPHGRPGQGAHHAGDLPNLRTDGEGNVNYLVETGSLSLTEGPTRVIGRIVIVASRPDDYRTQPDGNSGPPLACGFIRPANSALGVPVR
jgi:Cu-Zn family superoxide dismutase